MESIEKLQSKLHDLSQMFIQKQQILVDEQSNAVYGQVFFIHSFTFYEKAMKQIKFLQDLQNQQMNYQVSIIL